jgi:hypothetical protein
MWSSSPLQGITKWCRDGATQTADFFFSWELCFADLVMARRFLTMLPPFVGNDELYIAAMIVAALLLLAMMPGF